MTGPNLSAWIMCVNLLRKIVDDTIGTLSFVRNKSFFYLVDLLTYWLVGRKGYKNRYMLVQNFRFCFFGVPSKSTRRLMSVNVQL